MSSTVEILAPADQAEGTRSQLLRWLKQVGEAVGEHEPLIEIETDKVTVEVAAPASGVLREILKGEQDEIAPGEVLGRLEIANGAAQRGAEAVEASESAAASAPSPRAEGAGATSPGGENRAAATASPALSLSPAVRRLLAERGLEASMIRGSGEGGRITVDDVVNHAAGADHPTTARGNSQPLSRATDTQISSHSVPHSAVRKRIAEHMVQSLLHTAPHVTTVFEADLSAVSAHRAHHRADFEKRGAPLTFTAYFLAAAVQALRAVPEANSRWTDNALEVWDTINIGVATALENVGLVVPVLRAVESRDLFGVAQGLNELVTAARAGRLQPADVRGGTFTLSNHGVSGSLLAAPIIINQPQSAILGVGKLEKRPVVLERDGREELVIRPKCYVTLTIDHRVMDGHQANRFLQTFVSALESWPAP